MCHNYLQGNEENRLVVLNNKVIDNVNFLLRMDNFEGCSFMEIFSLQEAIADLLIALIEESVQDKKKINIALVCIQQIFISCVLAVCNLLIIIPDN